MTRLWSAHRRPSGLPDALDDDATRHGLHGPWAHAEERDGIVTIVRDAIGLMPAYWGRLPGGAIAMSDSIADLVEWGCDGTPDPSYAVAQAYRAAGLVPTQTVVLGVHRVPPGCEVSIRVADPSDPGTVRRWWRPQDAPRQRRIGLAEAAEELRGLMRTVVDDAVAVTDGPVAAHVSGGLDSTSVAVLASRSLQERGRRLDLVVSWSPEEATAESVDGLDLDGVEFDERQVVRDVAAELGVDAMFATSGLTLPAWLDEAGAVQPRETILWEASLLPRMAQVGIRHVMSGWGGDEFASFNGRAGMRSVLLSGRLSLYGACYSKMRLRGYSRARSIVELAKSAAPMAVRLRLPSIRTGTPKRQREETAALARIDPELARLVDRRHRRIAGARSPRAAQAALYANGHLQRRIEAWHEAGRRFGITYHYPLLDVRVVEWALSMPPEVWFLPVARAVFVEALEGLVDERVTSSRKLDPVLVSLVRLALDEHPEFMAEARGDVVDA